MGLKKMSRAKIVFDRPSRRWPVIVVLVTATGAALYAWHLLSSDANTQVTSTAAESRSSAAPSVYTFSSQASGPAPSKPDVRLPPRLANRNAPVNASSVQRFYAADDVQQFLQAALEHTTPENLLLANQAQLECDGDWVPGLVRRDEPILDPHRLQILESRDRRCKNYDRALVKRIRQKISGDSVLSNEILDSAEAPYYLRLIGNLDQYTYLEKRGTSSIKYAADILTNSDDAAVVFDAAKTLANSSPERIQLDGKALTAVEQASFAAAVMLATCDIGVPCDRSNPMMARLCAVQGICEFDSLEDLLRSTSPEKLSLLACCPDPTLYDFATASKLRQSLSIAIRNGNRELITVKQ